MCTESPERAASRSLASPWHTAALVFVILAVAVTGSLLMRQGAATPAQGAARAAGSRIFTQYLPLLVVNGGLAVYVCRLFRVRNALPDLLGRRWDSARAIATDLAFALVTFALIHLSEVFAAHAFDAGRNAAVIALLPSTVAERLTWLLVALSVGFCEEVVYRGYLQTQLAAFTHRQSWGVVLQAVLFGVAHAEQGVASALRIAGYGLLLGALARFRRSLLPGIVCHVLIDVAGGLFR